LTASEEWRTTSKQEILIFPLKFMYCWPLLYDENHSLGAFKTVEFIKSKVF
jgi:hypothetical protein